MFSYEYDFVPLACPRYEANAFPPGLPQRSRVEYNWLFRQRWLWSKKTFSEASLFIMTHFACLIYPSELPLVMQPCATRNLMGLEKIELTLPTDAFFLIFKVSAPPFPTSVRPLALLLLALYVTQLPPAGPPLLRRNLVRRWCLPRSHPQVDTEFYYDEPLVRYAIGSLG